MKIAASMATVKPIEEILHTHIHRTDYERDPANLHASDVTREAPVFCPRSVYIKTKTNAPRKAEEVQTAMAVTWEWGRMVESRVRDWFVELGMAVGHWSCDHCGKYTEWSAHPGACLRCNHKNHTYHEIRAKSQDSGIGCGLDLLIARGGGSPLRYVEIKSIDKDKFKELKMPKGEHRARTRLGLRCMAEAEDARFVERCDLNNASILYVSKGGFGTTASWVKDLPFPDGRFSPFKVYAINRDDEAVQPYVESARAAKRSLTGEGPIPQRICPSQLCSRAQQCTVASTCFNSGGW